METAHPLPAAARRPGDVEASLRAHPLDADALARLLAAAHWRDVARVSTGELLGLVRGLPPSALAAHPRALLQVARAAERSADVDAREELLGRALGLIGTGPLRREVEAELCAARAVTQPGPAIDRAARDVLGAA